jgi:hypothetical protein
MGLMTLAGAAFAQTAALTTTSFAPGIPQARSANYLVDGALDPSGGVIAISENYVLKPGYIGQLHDPVSLAVAPRFATFETLVPVDEQLDQVVIDPAAAESGASYRVILDQAP